MGLLIGFVVSIIILSAAAKMLSTPPDAYADLETHQDDHGHH